MKVKRSDPLFSIGCQLFAFIWKLYEGKKSYFGRRVFIFVLPIRNKSLFLGKIITSFKIERMTINLLAIWPKHKIEMQIIYDGRKVQVWEFVSQGLNIGKWSTGKHCDGVAVVKNMKTIMCQEGGTLPLTRAPLGYFYNAPHWGGGGYFGSVGSVASGYSRGGSDLRNYWTDSKNSSGIWKPWKNCRRKTNFIDLGVTSDVTGQVKVKMFDISGLVTSASKIAMLSTNKVN